MINKTLLKAEAEKIGVFLDETALKRLDMYAEMLVETNKTLNLTAITDADTATTLFSLPLSLFRRVAMKSLAPPIAAFTPLFSFFTK